MITFKQTTQPTMKHILLLIIFSSLLLTSCITIEETYSFKEDGSGKGYISINMSQMKAIMESMGGLLDEEKISTLNAINFDSHKNTLSTINGISDINSKIDQEHYRFELTYNFTNQEALNQVLNTIFESKNLIFFNKKKKLVTLTHPLPHLITQQLKDMESQQMINLLESVTYSIAIEFLRPVKKVSTTAKNTISEDKQTLTLMSNLQELVKSPDNFNTTIKLK